MLKSNSFPLFKTRPFIRNLVISITVSLTITFCLGESWAQEDEQDEIPTRYGLATILGNSYTPSTDISYVQISGFALYDYDRVWHHAAPEALRFKVECSLGVRTRRQTRVMASLGILALHYLDNFASKRLRPYVEAGIGVAYTDFKVEGQGLRVNFNPQVGIGTEFLVDSGPPYFAAIRLQHISNAKIDHDNRGINSVVLMIGRFF